MNRFRRVAGYCLLCVFTLLMSGCAAFYVDGNAPEIPSSAYRKPESPGPVQLVWEFRTKGVPNAQATEFLKTRVRDQIAASTLFSQVSDAAEPGSGLLSVTVNNVPLSDDAARKGFVAGLTFGIAGQTVADGYECTMRYVPARDNAQALERSGKHVIYTSVGSTSPPPGGLKMSGVEEAVTTMIRQIVSRTLNDIAEDPAFP
ncbi:hypothetical protein [Methyloversatilis sp.]|jgi:hypothetical protein|uniref:hypothetical protein n=1 Tax=Methyloversatilis sp. TaxID=2569862 RepID=UPI003D27B45C